MSKAVVKFVKYTVLSLVCLFVALHLLIASLLLVWKYVPVTNSMFMTLHRLQSETKIEQTWLGSDQLSDNLKRAVLTAEDSGFMDHHGFEIESMKAALEANENGKSIRGGSTVTQQLAKNLFLTPHRSYVRKAEEALITLMIETMWSKDRILTVYLNVVEFGDGVYGAEAAAQHYFGKSAKSLTKDQAAFLACILPQPKYFETHRSSSRLMRKKRKIIARMHQVRVPKTI